jgi:hypothetical protein
MRTAATLLAYGAALALGLYLTFSPTFVSCFSHMQTERGDGMLNHYIVEHTWQAISNPAYAGSFFSPACFHPEPSTLWYSEHLLGVAPLYWGLRTFLSDFNAYQWWQIILDSLNFVAFAIAARWFGLSHVLAILGAFFWAFAVVNTYQLGHQQMIPRFWMPLAAYYAWSFAVTPRASSLNRMLACVFLQCVSCMYTGWFLVGALGIFLPLSIGLVPGSVSNTKRFLLDNKWKVLVIVGGWGTALVAAFVPYLVVNWGMSRSYSDCFGFMPTASAWFKGPEQSRWEQTLRPNLATVYGECYLFCGFGVYLLMFAATVHLLGHFRQPERDTAMILTAAALITADAWLLFTLTPAHAGPSLWQLVRHIPGGGAIRCVSRVYVVVYLFGIIGALVWLNTVTLSARPWVRTLILSAIAAAVIFEQTGYEPHSFEKHDFYDIADRVGAQLEGADAGFIVREYTDTKGFISTGVYGDVLAMWAGLRANVPVVNGYSGRWPPGETYPGGMALASDEQLRKWLAGKFRGKVAIIHPDHPESRRVIVID